MAGLDEECWPFLMKYNVGHFLIKSRHRCNIYSTIQMNVSSRHSKLKLLCPLFTQELVIHRNIKKFTLICNCNHVNNQCMMEITYNLTQTCMYHTNSVKTMVWLIFFISSNTYCSQIKYTVGMQY